MSGVKQRSGELWVLMQARRLGAGRNPLCRSTDRIETVLLWCTLVVALLLVPFGAAVSTTVGNALDASAARQRAVLQMLPARTLESTERQVPAVQGDVLSRVPVTYVDPQGVEHRAVTNVVIGTKAGAEVEIWLDRSGSIVTAPRAKSDSLAFGALAGVFTVLGGWLVVWALFSLAKRPLNRRRFRDWDAEWQAVAPRWSRGQK